MSTAVILQSNYIPWRGYFDLIAKADHFVFYDEVQFTKNDWRNRNVIVGKPGPHWLTIPVATSKKFGQSVFETKVTDARWARKHWNAIQTDYGKAPHFQDVADFIRSLYDTASAMDTISEINRFFIVSMAQFLDFKTRFHLSSDIAGTAGKTERLVDICSFLQVDEYLSGRAAQSYLDCEVFSEAGISVRWMNYPDYRGYVQNDGEYRSGVSILDSLFFLPAQNLFDLQNP